MKKEAKLEDASSTDAADDRDPKEADRLPTKAELAEDLAEVSPRVKKVSELLAMSVSGRMGYQSALERFTDQHIDKFLDYCQEDDRHAYQIERTNRWFRLVYVVIGLSLFIFLVLYLIPTDKALLLDIIKMTVAFLGGLGSGFGLKTHFDKRRS